MRVCVAITAKNSGIDFERVVESVWDRLEWERVEGIQCNYILINNLKLKNKTEF